MTGKNVEIKARIINPGNFYSKVEQLCPEKPEILQQIDTFFHCASGRLKLREFGNGSGELIYYNRKNITGPKLSEYLRYESNHPEVLKTALISACGVLGVVEKKRRLLILGQTRIHIDQVKYLGDFLELEVVLKPKQGIEDGVKIAEEIMKKLGVTQNDLVESAYIDLLSD